jgi:hypothetical protein
VAPEVHHAWAVVEHEPINLESDSLLTFDGCEAAGIDPPKPLVLDRTPIVIIHYRKPVD